MDGRSANIDALERTLRALGIRVTHASESSVDAVVRQTSITLAIVGSGAARGLQILRAIGCPILTVGAKQGSPHTASVVDDPKPDLTTPFTTAEAVSAIVRKLRLNAARSTATDSAGLANASARSGMRPAPGCVAERWAGFVLAAVDAAADPRTATQWANAIGVSRTTLGECCRLVQVPTHDARDFARLLRAIWRSGHEWRPDAVLDVADSRTLRKLGQRSGLPWYDVETPTVRHFLNSQHWIPQHNPGLLALRAWLCEDLAAVPR